MVKNVSPLTVHSALPFRVQVPVMVALVSVYVTLVPLPF